MIRDEDDQEAFGQAVCVGPDCTMVHVAVDDDELGVGPGVFAVAIHKGDTTLILDVAVGPDPDSEIHFDVRAIHNETLDPLNIVQLPALKASAISGIVEPAQSANRRSD